MPIKVVTPAGLNSLFLLSRLRFDYFPSRLKNGEGVPVDSDLI
jgi:hypothetical protein